ncbi:hypothetical protein EDB87DRAFT_1833035 [Lactarius vividus]|nr:hypothetical protein EDB87DRAFT_1833035 [Lactarius vividus]
MSHIQAFPGFDNFLTSPPFDILRSATSSGPVIIINHSGYRSDILILLYCTSPSLTRVTPTPHDFYHRASPLCYLAYESFTTSFANLSSTDFFNRKYQRAIPRLAVSGLSLLFLTPHPSTLWVLSHNGSPEQYFLVIYIPSYTPILSALVHGSGHHESCSTLDHPSLLLVAHFDVPSPGRVIIRSVQRR